MSELTTPDVCTKLQVKAFSFPAVDWVQVRLMRWMAASAVADGSLGYAVITATAPSLRYD